MQNYNRNLTLDYLHINKYMSTNSASSSHLKVLFTLASLKQTQSEDYATVQRPRQPF